ncbi:hypothetical protein Hanom_Chr01g00045841 [Helianthus anomalus]
MWNGYARKNPEGGEALNLKLKTVNTKQKISFLTTSMLPIQKLMEMMDQMWLNKWLRMFWVKKRIKIFLRKLNQSVKKEVDYLKTSENSLIDDPTILMYKMCGSDQLHSDSEFLIQNVNMDRVEKVFQLLEIEISEIESLTS